MKEGSICGIGCLLRARMDVDDEDADGGGGGRGPGRCRSGRLESVDWE
jgi:hypothetical protein